mgnify:CR=1 FL=1
MKLYILHHVHPLADDREDVKLLGIYSSRSLADAAVKRYLVLPGFVDAKDGFDISEIEVDKDDWTEGYATVAYRQGGPRPDGTV